MNANRFEAELARQYRELFKTRDYVYSAAHTTPTWEWKQRWERRQENMQGSWREIHLRSN